MIIRCDQGRRSQDKQPCFPDAYVAFCFYFFSFFLNKLYFKWVESLIKKNSVLSLICFSAAAFCGLVSISVNCDMARCSYFFYSHFSISTISDRLSKWVQFPKMDKTFGKTLLTLNFDSTFKMCPIKGTNYFQPQEGVTKSCRTKLFYTFTLHKCMDTCFSLVWSLQVPLRTITYIQNFGNWKDIQEDSL